MSGRVDEVGQQALVEVRGQQDDEGCHVDAQHDKVARIAPAPGQAAEGHSACSHDDHAAPVETAHGAVSVDRPPRCEPVGGEAEERSQDRPNEHLSGHGREWDDAASIPTTGPCDMAADWHPWCRDAAARTY